MRKVLFWREILDCVGDQANEVVSRSFEAVEESPAGFEPAILAIESGFGEKLDVECLSFGPFVVRVSRWISAEDSGDPCENGRENGCKKKCKCGFWQPAFDWIAVEDQSEVADFNAETGCFCEGADGAISIWLEQTLQGTAITGVEDLGTLLSCDGVYYEEGLLSFDAEKWDESRICETLGIARGSK